jgi:hypothetical protein
VNGTATETARCPECQRRKPGFWARLRRVHWRLAFVTTFGALLTTFVAWVGGGATGVFFACFGLACALLGAYALGLTSGHRRRS